MGMISSTIKVVADVTAVSGDELDKLQKESKFSSGGCSMSGFSTSGSNAGGCCGQ
jgi:hypothetical protein